MLAGELVGLLLVEVRQRALLRAPAQRVDVATSIVRRRSFPGCRAAVSRGSSIDQGLHDCLRSIHNML